MCEFPLSTIRTTAMEARRILSDPTLLEECTDRTVIDMLTSIIHIVDDELGDSHG